MSYKPDAKPSFGRIFQSTLTDEQKQITLMQLIRENDKESLDDCLSVLANNKQDLVNNKKD